MDGKQQTALVTGGGRGLGRQIALKLADSGKDIVIADLNPEEMGKTKRMVHDHGQSAMTVQMDLREEDDVSDTVEAALDEFGAIDILINNAGIAGPNLPCEEISIDEWDNTIAVNLRGVFLMTREVIPTMKAQEYGRIINISSVTGKRPVSQRSPYAATKLGLVGFTRSIASEVGEYNINVNAVCPGSVEGDRIERVFKRYAKARGTDEESVKRSEMEKSARGELVKPDSVADVVDFLCSSQSTQMTGQDLNITAGKVMY
ncbi:SDR family NAD(P)-dependent oxidoreductase [Natronosalvus halobius]|uniref:SDR family NAD(P)-dependent oxidoreductase n=1 Tax=Natronosalvus halobius TaxID=2953746 RepID=UPI0020A1671F|nr:SDR family NAD(P)-dependent oxidoreductase [Natronosalvus halobius]USZ73705.1 SDR family oxidoreductase [Natronosalvus halobius]